MKRLILIISAGAVLLCVCFCIFYSKTDAAAAYSLAITFGTIAYHFLMRLIIGLVIGLIMENRADYTKKWYQCREWEKLLYKRIHIKKWKQTMPTYEPDYFDPRKHSWTEIAQAMCQAEVVHEVIIVFSFVPVVFSVWFGAIPVFVITSVLAAAFDLIFVMMQRYNRSRIVKLIQ